MTERSATLLTDVDPKRDAYGFAVRPQHLQRYREYEDIYKEEEEERYNKWKSFLDLYTESTRSSEKEHSKAVDAGAPANFGEEDDPRGGKSFCNGSTEGEETNPDGVKKWCRKGSSLGVIEKIMSLRIKKKDSKTFEPSNQSHLPSFETKALGVECDGNAVENNFDELVDNSVNASTHLDTIGDEFSPEPSFLWKELVFLVHGGVPRALRGEAWQAFVGVHSRRVDRYYQDLLAPETNMVDCEEHENSFLDSSTEPHAKCVDIPENWRKQIEKDLPRTFPGHPALDEDGRNSLRRLLIAYARHNPSVGYCQALNFFGGLLLLMMPEENAFWTLVGIIDNYFEGYYFKEMTESQVDQLIFEELMRERFPKLVNHLDYLGVEVAWVSGSWFLSIFVNVLPWESVLRVWDVLLFDGNRVMLFRTALALMDLYGPAIVTTKDVGDAVTLMQSLAGSTFDSSQLVLTACMGFLVVNEVRLQELRSKHRPTILEAAEKRKKQGQLWEDSKGLATKLYTFKHAPESLINEESTNKGLGDMITDECMPLPRTCTPDLEDFLSGLTLNSGVGSVSDLQERVIWMKVELCRLLEEKRSSTLRAEELEIALMEMVKKDNRRQLTARVEHLEQEVSELRQVLVDKREQEIVMLQVLMRVEQEQRVTEGARISAEQDAAAQKYAVHLLQEKYEKVIASLAQMEKRVVTAESRLEATLQCESGRYQPPASPRPVCPEAQTTGMRGLLSLPFGWRDRNKEPVETKSINEGVGPNTLHKDANGQQQQETKSVEK